MLKKSIIFIVSLIALIFLINNVIMPLYVKHADTVKVPKITGMNYIEAQKIIEEGGLEIIQGDVKYDENIPIGEILDQNPPADETVKYGRRIYVTICGGEELSDVPNLIGRSLRDAKFTLEQRGLKLGETVKKNTSEFPVDHVVSQIIQPGSKVKKNSTMDLILSDGPLAGDLKVPEVTGKNLEEAKKIISENKLKLGKITYQTNNDVPAGQIVDQYPKVDKSANENTVVDLFVARKKVIIQKEIEEEADDPNLSKDKTVSDKENIQKAETQKDKVKENSKQDQTDKSNIKKTDKAPADNDNKDTKINKEKTNKKVETESNSDNKKGSDPGDN